MGFYIEPTKSLTFSRGPKGCQAPIQDLDIFFHKDKLIKLKSHGGGNPIWYHGNLLAAANSNPPENSRPYEQGSFDEGIMVPFIDL